MENKKIKKWEPEDFELEMTTHWSFPKRGDWATHDAKWRGNWSPRHSKEYHTQVFPRRRSGVGSICRRRYYSC